MKRKSDRHERHVTHTPYLKKVLLNSLLLEYFDLSRVETIRLVKNLDEHRVKSDKPLLLYFHGHTNNGSVVRDKFRPCSQTQKTQKTQYDTYHHLGLNGPRMLSTNQYEWFRYKSGFRGMKDPCETEFRREFETALNAKTLQDYNAITYLTEEDSSEIHGVVEKIVLLVHLLYDVYPALSIYFVGTSQGAAISFLAGMKLCASPNRSGFRGGFFHHMASTYQNTLLHLLHEQRYARTACSAIEIEMDEEERERVKADIVATDPCETFGTHSDVSEHVIQNMYQKLQKLQKFRLHATRPTLTVQLSYYDEVVPYSLCNLLKDAINTTLRRSTDTMFSQTRTYPSTRARTLAR